MTETPGPTRPARNDGHHKTTDRTFLSSGDTAVTVDRVADTTVIEDHNVNIQIDRAEGVLIVAVAGHDIVTVITPAIRTHGTDVTDDEDNDYWISGPDAVAEGTYIVAAWDDTGAYTELERRSYPT